MRQERQSKLERHSKIVELIGKCEIGTQEELAERLRGEGFRVTQATVSRDIRELRLTKVPGESGRQKYVVLQSDDNPALSQKYIQVLRGGFVRMDGAQNILIIHTVTGTAMAVAAAIDAIHFQEIIGSIAGDDVIMCVVRTTDDAAVLMSKIQRLVDE